MDPLWQLQHQHQHQHRLYLYENAVLKDYYQIAAPIEYHYHQGTFDANLLNPPPPVYARKPTGRINTPAPVRRAMKMLRQVLPRPIGIYSPSARRRRLDRFLLKRRCRVWNREGNDYLCRRKSAIKRQRAHGRFVKRDEEAQDHLSNSSYPQEENEQEHEAPDVDSESD